MLLQPLVLLVIKLHKTYTQIKVYVKLKNIWLKENLVLGVYHVCNSLWRTKDNNETKRMYTTPIPKDVYLQQVQQVDEI